MRFFCPACWVEVPETARACSHCGADLTALDADAFEQKLVRALESPEPMTACRAADILGRRSGRSALRPLIDRLRRDPDPYLAAAIATSLGRIGGTRAMRALDALSAHPSIIVRHAAEAALDQGSRGLESPAPTDGPRTVRFTDAQSRHIGLMLNRLVRETRDRIEHWEEAGAQGVGRSAVKRSLQDLLFEAERCADRLGIELTDEVKDPRRTMAAWATAWWSAVLDSRPAALRGYGQVDATTAEVVAPIVEELAALLLRVRAVAEGREDG